MFTLGSSILGATAELVPDWLATAKHIPTKGPSMEKQVVDMWLVDVLKSVSDIGKTFDLHKVMYGAGQVAWICAKHTTSGLKNNSLKLFSEDM
jgi:hypothetical protein